MTSIKEIRTAIDAGLDRLQAKAEAAEKQVSLSSDDLNIYINEQKEKLNDASVKLQEKLNEAVALSEDSKIKILGAAEHLQVQLALGAADTRDSFTIKKKEIQRAIAKFNAEIDAAEEREATAELNALMQVYVTQAVILESDLEEMEEMEEQYKL